MINKNEPYVFISYAKEDYKIANTLYNFLKENGVKAWMDIHSLLPGQSWKVEIQEAIQKCFSFIALLSNKALDKRGFIQKELRAAINVLDEFPDSSIYIIPARLDNCLPSNERLANLHWVDLFPDFDSGFNLILKSLKTAGMKTNDLNIAKNSIKLKRNIDNLSSIEVVVIDELRNKPDVIWTYSYIEQSIKMNRSESLWFDNDIRTVIDSMIRKGYFKIDINNRITVTYKAIEYYRNNPRKY